jgi:hypothetical protein
MTVVEAIRELRHLYEQIERGRGSKVAFWQAASFLESSTTYRHLMVQEGQLVTRSGSPVSPTATPMMPMGTYSAMS